VSTTTSTLKSNKNYHFGEIIGQYRSQPGTDEGKTFKNIDILLNRLLTELCKGENEGVKRMKNKNKETD